MAKTTFVGTRANRGVISTETVILLVGVTAVIVIAASFLGSEIKGSFAYVGKFTPTEQRSAARVPVTTVSSPEQTEVPTDDPMPGLFVMAILGCLAATGLTIVAARRVHSRVENAEPLSAHGSAATVAHQSRLFEKRQNVLRILARDTQALFEGRMTVRQLMSPQVHTVPANSAVSELRTLCRDKQIRHLLVCDSVGRLIGVVSDRDLSVRVGQTASDIMTSNPVTVSPETLVGPAMTTMLDKRVHCLPVIVEGKPCGMLTTSDLLMALQCALQLLAKASVCGVE